MKEKFKEVQEALQLLGYARTEQIILHMLDPDRTEVIHEGQIIGIYDFTRHTFID